jgi:hypothetical protein
MSGLLFENLVPIDGRGKIELDYCTACQAITGSGLRDIIVTNLYPAVLFRPCHWICYRLS